MLFVCNHPKKADQLEIKNLAEFIREISCIDMAATVRFLLQVCHRADSPVYVLAIEEG